jgi:hypothetical protein
MNPRRRLVSFVILNIVVSALVTGTILFFYDRAYPPDCGTSLPQTTSTAGEVNVEITGVSGAGTTASETVGIRNDGTAALVLTGWTLKDDQGNIYAFPQLTLYPDGIVKVHTASGDDTASDLHWDRSSPVWTSGELAALYDAQNIARAFYRIP